MYDPNVIMPWDIQEETFCPNCGSDQVVIIAEDDLITGLGMYAIFDIPQGLAALESGCYCHACGHWWSGA